MLILACGNPLREDDGLAWKLAEALHGPGLDVRCVHQLGPELAEDVSRAEAVLFLDAQEGGEPGTVRIEDLSPAPEGPGLSHALSPRALLLCAERLYGRAPRAALLTVTGERFGHGEGLSAKVEAALPEGVRLARRTKAGARAARVAALALLLLATAGCGFLRSQVTIENRSGSELTDVLLIVRNHAILELDLGSLPPGEKRVLPLSVLGPESLGFTYSSGGRDFKGECGPSGSPGTHWLITVAPTLDARCEVER